MYFMSDSKSGTQKNNIWKTDNTRTVLGEEVCKCLPFIHDFLDVTQHHIYKELEKAYFWKNVSKIKISDSCQYISTTWSNPWHSSDSWWKHILALYNCAKIQSLDILRYCKFLQKVQTKSTNLHVQSLPPTSDAARFHSYRTFLQAMVTQWYGSTSMGLGKSKQPTGSKKGYITCSPDRLLIRIRCSCKQDCDSRRCTCRKHGLPCTPACGDCRVLCCSNRDTSIDYFDQWIDLHADLFRYYSDCRDN